MTDTVAACRAALLKACRNQSAYVRGYSFNQWVDVDDAAACMAEREAKLRTALERIARGEGRFNRDPLKHAENVIAESIEVARAALASVHDAECDGLCGWSGCPAALAAAQTGGADG